MKTTSYEISKKLAELGFDRAFDFAYKKNDEVNVWNEAFEIRCWDLNRLDYYPAYDLETILEALPKSVDDSYYNLKIQFDGEYVNGRHSTFNYLDIDGFVVNENGVNLETSWNGKESLADTAARLLILLHEKGLVIFNQSTNNTNDNT